MKKIVLSVLFVVAFIATSQAYTNEVRCQASYNDSYLDKWVKNVNASEIFCTLYASGSYTFAKYTHSAVTIFTNRPSGKMYSNWVYNGEVTKTIKFSAGSGYLVTKVKLQSSGEVKWYQGSKYPFNSWSILAW